MPYQPPWPPTSTALEAIRKSAVVPVWLPWPLPAGWLVTGFGEVGDQRTGARASLVALTGPSLMEGPADLLVIAEEPGIGIGAAFAGLDGPDPGEGFDSGPPNAKIHVLGHPTALWCVGGAADRAVYAGEALGNWLWTIAWPADAGCMIALSELSLLDVRDHDLDVPYGAFSPRLED
ncbi:hypothetical protein FH608_032405 [Nonomuraea phyllanthi]|uniref:Uncharacterized protein n=1 Tax=Nonomuraea phyllanthi TaxID=2219224 RepID=A0A5C4VB47_9ACTN|nr:hypothetical protein FH608_032405 [Nonomuraea phyllanthi]QFY14909.1 hypothetical protein GBF35_44210 [Nonomuraea phyllanthi]